MAPLTDLVCFSHLRWGFVFQRPNHLMSRASRARRTFFVEEPRLDAAPGTKHLEVSEVSPSLSVCVPHLPPGLPPDESHAALRGLVDRLFADYRIQRDVLWYYTPMALPYTRHLDAQIIVYDCMDELTAFKDAPAGLHDLETELFARADLVFTGGYSLYYSKQQRHSNVHPFPSSVEAAHFALARQATPDPADQAPIPHPRIGYFGVIDERLDLDLIGHVAMSRPDWHLVLLGPVAKIDPSALPQGPNLHWLGQKDYASLPSYLAGWDAAIMPFALNRSTKFISPTKTLEYMAAGKPVVSTAIADVVEPYGHAGAVRIADKSGFVHAIQESLDQDPFEVLRSSDAWVGRTSWDKTWQQMEQLMFRTLIGMNAARERVRNSCTTT